MKPLLLFTVLSACLAAADTIQVEPLGPVSSTVVLLPLTVEEAQKWHMFSQVKAVMEKESVLVDTMEAKNQILLVHSISYFKGSGGQLYAIVNYLRPRVPAK